MRKEHDSRGGKRLPPFRSPGKKRITIMIDRDVIEAFRSWADSSGRGYQTLMNDVLRATLGQDGQVPRDRKDSAKRVEA